MLRMMMVMIALGVELGFSTLIDGMEIGANALRDIGAIFFWDVKLGKDNGETSFMSLQLGLMPYLEGNIVIVSLVFHEGLGTCICARAKDLAFGDSNPMTDM